MMIVVNGNCEENCTNLRIARKKGSEKEENEISESMKSNKFSFRICDILNENLKDEREESNQKTTTVESRLLLLTAIFCNCTFSVIIAYCNLL